MPYRRRAVDQNISNNLSTLPAHINTKIRPSGVSHQLNINLRLTDEYMPRIWDVMDSRRYITIGRYETESYKSREETSCEWCCEWV